MSNWTLERLPFFGRNEPNGDKPIELLPLTPNYDEASHKVYFNAIESALSGANRKKIRNIALTGSYGVGKSSILQKVAETHEGKVVQISLSTLGLSDQEAKEGSDKAAVSTTNRIQKEIVKQLLYREEPVKMPGSRYRRLERFKPWRALAVAALVAIALSLISFLMGWTERIDALAMSYFDRWPDPNLVVFVVATGFILASQALFHNRIRVEQLSAGAATISLSANSTTFFDEYLDEIIYFFDVTGHDLVIFEDIDRFDDPHIFETLKALNTLLNGAKQLKKRNIRFIYAIKDSIFDELGTRAAREEGRFEGAKQTDAVDTELARANRTKFFDLVIPVVPFITHLNARDLMVREMDKIKHEVSRELIELAARHLPDMRLIKNIRNEFVIFREKILLGTESIPDLAEDQLFAMMLYKSTHLSDFESIKDGQSKLDLLYTDSRKLVADNIASLELESRTKLQRLKNPDSVGTRSAVLGDALLGYIERLGRQSSVPERTTRTVTFAGQTRSDDELRTAGFWQEFVEADSALDVIFIDNYYGRQAHRLNISRADVSEALRDSLSIDDWQVSDRAKLRDRLKEIDEERDFLDHADMGDLMKREEFTLELSKGELKSFRQLADEHLQSKLARQLVEAGYINRDFTLYTSTYYAELVSSRATNFMIHNVNRNVQDAHFQLTADDVEAVLRELGESVLRERGMYNINVLDQLLETADPRADILINKLIAFGRDEQSFLQTYLSGGKQKESLIRKLADRWQRTFDFVVTTPALDETMRVQLVNAAVEGMAKGIKYVANGDVRTYFEEHYSELDAFVSNETSADTASLIAELLTEMGARLGSLERLGSHVRQAVIARNRYRITRENLVTITGGVQELPLDNIREHQPTAYAYLLDHLSDYLAALQETQPEPTTIRNATAFGVIIEEVLEHNESLLTEVIASASPVCQIINLTEVSEATWPVLAVHKRFPATFENVTAYIDAAGLVDAPLAQLLTAVGSVTVPPDVEESEKEGLALSILAARDTLPEHEVRTNLVVTIDLKEFLPVTLIQPESGKLIGLLISELIIPDNAESFALSRGTNWQTREFAISQSKRFPAYMTTSEVPTSDVAQLMNSSLVSDEVKEAILDRVDEFVPSNDREALTAIASFAEYKQKKLPIELVARMGASRVESQLILCLLEPLLAELTEADLVPILSEMGDVYATLSERNGKHPKLRRTGPHLALVKRLEELGVVSSHDVRNDKISVNMRREVEPA